MSERELPTSSFWTSIQQNTVLFHGTGSETKGDPWPLCQQRRPHLPPQSPKKQFQVENLPNLASRGGGGLGAAGCASGQQHQEGRSRASQESLRRRPDTSYWCGAVQPDPGHRKASAACFAEAEAPVRAARRGGPQDRADRQTDRQSGSQELLTPCLGPPPNCQRRGLQAALNPKDRRRLWDSHQRLCAAGGRGTRKPSRLQCGRWLWLRGHLKDRPCGNCWRHAQTQSGSNAHDAVRLPQRHRGVQSQERAPDAERCARAGRAVSGTQRGELRRRRRVVEGPPAVAASHVAALDGGLRGRLHLRGGAGARQCRGAHPPDGQRQSQPW
jgi:hypothetical protein